MKPLAVTFLILAIFGISIGFFFGFQSGERSDFLAFFSDLPKERAPSRPEATFSYGIVPSDMYEKAYARIGEREKVNPRSAIVAHHLLAAEAIAEVFARLASEKVETVVLLSPNHFSAGISPVQLGNVAFETPYGILEPDSDALDALALHFPSARFEPQTFKAEHGIGNLTPFIRASFPQARLVPIVLDESLPASEREKLAEALQETVPSALVIASIDMSHNLPHEVANFHDEITKRFIANGGCEVEDCRIDLEIDSNASLETLLSLNRLRGTQEWHLTYHSSSIGVGATSDWRENTSHILGYFQDGEPVREPFAAFHVVGDMMLDRGVRKITNREGIDYPWREMQGFLRGTHLTLGNLEGTVNEQMSTYTYDPPFRFVFSPESVMEMAKYVDAVSLANNHASDVGSAGERESQKRLTEIGVKWFGGYRTPSPRFDTKMNGFDLSFIGYHQFQPNLSELESLIRSAKEEGHFVIVMPHWGNEYIHAPQENQRALAEKIEEFGADLVIGGHPHVVQGAETVEGIPVLYSLGNFIFDQQIPETWDGLTVGVILSAKEITLHLLPVSAKNGQPMPLDAVSRKRILEKMAETSSEEIREMVREGIIILPYEKE